MKRVKEKIDETLTAGRLPKAHRWNRPLTTTAKRFSPTTPQTYLAPGAWRVAWICDMAHREIIHGKQLRLSLATTDRPKRFFASKIQCK
jgi:hypothetical protein